MYLKKIELHNIRGFESLDFDLTRPDGSYAGWTVFTGDTVPVKAACSGHSRGADRQGNRPRLAAQLSALGAGRRYPGQHSVNIVPEKGMDEFSGTGNTAFKPFPATVNLDAKDRDTRLEMEGVAKVGTPRGLWATDSRGWFSCGYGPFRRVFGASSEAMRLMVGATTERFVTMFQEAASLAEVDQWLRSLSHKKLETGPPKPPTWNCWLKCCVMS